MTQLHVRCTLFCTGCSKISRTDVVDKMVSDLAASDNDDDPNYIPPLKTASMDLSSEDNDPFEFEKTLSKRVLSVRNKWSENELEILKKAFSGFHKPPDNGTIKEVQMIYPVLQKRTVPQIKTRAWHQIRTGR